MTDIRKYISELVSKSIYPTLKSLTDGLASRIEKAIREKETPIGDPRDVVDPIIESQKEITQAIKAINIPEIPEFPKTDLSEVSSKLSELKDVFQKKELTVNQGDVNVSVDTKAVVKAIENLEKKIKDPLKFDQIDYTLMYDEMMKIMERIEKKEGKNYSEELLAVIDWLKAIQEKEYPEFPELDFDDDGRLKVSVDRIGGGSIGHEVVGLKSSSDMRINPATEGTLQAVLAATGTTSYNYIQSEDTGTYKYYGYASSTGWQIKRKTLATGVWEIVYDDFTGTYGNFDDAWTARAGLSYSYA